MSEVPLSNSDTSHLWPARRRTPVGAARADVPARAHHKLADRLQ